MPSPSPCRVPAGPPPHTATLLTHACNCKHHPGKIKRTKLRTSTVSQIPISIFLQYSTSLITDDSGSI